MVDDSVFHSASLCVVGNVNRDVKTAPVTPGPHLLEDGEDGVDWIEETIGGGGANSAAAAASLGARVALLGKVGDDPLGRRLEQTLARHGVAAHLRKDPRCATGTSIALAFDSGHRHFLSCLPNNRSLVFEDLDLEALARYEHLYRADVWFSEPMLFGGNRRLFELARQHGMAVSIDINWDPACGSSPEEEAERRKQAVRDVLPLVTLAHGNVRELNRLAGCTDLDATLRRLEEWGAEAVVVHMGADGAGYYHRGKLLVEKPVLARHAVNATGTGDVLSVCMMLLAPRDEIPVTERLHLANTVVSEFIEGRRLIPALGG